MKKQLIAAYILLLLSVFFCAAGLSEENDCEHQWVAYDIDAHGVLRDEIELYRIDNYTHAYMFKRPERVCCICGERVLGSAGGSATHIPHSYTVLHWQKNETGDAAIITWKCGVCKHEYTDELLLQTVRDGNAESCLHGGSCDLRTPGHLFENGMIMFDSGGYYLPYGFEAGEKKAYIAVIYDPAEQTFRYASREYCPLCGRPRNAATMFFPQTVFDTRWNGLPIMTEDYFLTDGIPENLPYQLIDQLREEAGVAP